MLFVVCHLNTTTTARLLDGLIHRVGNLIGIHDPPAVGVTRRTTNGLDQGTVIAKKAFLVGIKNGHQRYFGQVQALTQQVDAHQDIKLPFSQVTQDFNAFQCADVGMHITSANALIKQMLGKVFRHTFSKGGNQHALFALSALLRLVDNVIDLRHDGTNVNLGIKQASRSNNLLNLSLANTFLVIARSRGNIHELRNSSLKLVEAQGAIV